MVNPGLLQNFVLPYEPLPEAASQAALDSITKCGFARNAILEEYSFSSPNLAQPIKINALAFAHPVHRNPAEYASFTIFNAVNGHDDGALVPLLAESAAPFHLIHREDKFSFWASDSRNGQVQPREVQSSIAYEQLGNVLGVYAVDLKPQKIIDVKQGRDTFTIFRDMQPLQLSLWAGEVTRKLLVRYFGNAVGALRDYEPRMPDKVIIRIAIQLLGALILADTGVLGSEIRLNGASLDKLILKTHSQFDSYFQPTIFQENYNAAEEAYQVLRQIRYAGFMPDMLTEIFSKAYGQEVRKKLGRFDTPLYLTRRIWENIPVEYLPPEKRVIADMTCGWGSFLIAGHERLSNLSDTPQSLREYLRGNDIDPFTAQLAGLGLLLSTSEDSWYIDDEDALEWHWLNAHEPNIIVGNPPFETVQDISLEGEKGWHEKANKFLKHAIERLAPGGYIAMLMPCSFTSSLASPILRKQLLETCDVFELWELPIEVFRKATAQTIVIFAQKQSENLGPKPVRVRTIQPNILNTFKSSGIFTASDLMLNQSNWNKNVQESTELNNTYKMDYKLALPESTWRSLKSHCTVLREHVEITKGASVGKPENKPWRDFPYPKKVRWLTGVKKVMSRPFFIDYDQATVITYPNDLERPRKDKKRPENDKEYLLAGTKVLLPYDPHPSWGKRTKVAIERRGYYVSDSFWVIAPTPFAQQIHITHEVLAAIVSWDVSNAWIIEHLKSPAIRRYALETIPFPKNLSKDHCQALTEAVLMLEEEAKASRFESQATKNANRTIDTILKAAYHLDDITFDRLRKIAEWDRTPQTTLDIQPNRNEANWSISGIVDSVNAEQDTITLWMEGFNELQTVKITPSIPGWMLRPEATFRTKIPRRYVKQGYIGFDTIDWGTFSPQPYAYMNEEELLEEFSNIFREDGRSRVG